MHILLLNSDLNNTHHAATVLETSSSFLQDSGDTKVQSRYLNAMNPTSGNFSTGLTSILPINTPSAPKPKVTIPPPAKATAIGPPAAASSAQPTTAKGKPKAERKRKTPEDKEKKPRAPKPPADPNAPKKPKKVKQPGEQPAKPRKPKDGNQSPSFFDELEEYSKDDGAIEEEEAPPKEEDEDEDENLFEDDEISTPDKARVRYKMHMRSL